MKLKKVGIPELSTNNKKKNPKYILALNVHKYSNFIIFWIDLIQHKADVVTTSKHIIVISGLKASAKREFLYSDCYHVLRKGAIVIWFQQRFDQHSNQIH